MSNDNFKIGLYKIHQVQDIHHTMKFIIWIFKISFANSNQGWMLKMTVWWIMCTGKCVESFFLIFWNSTKKAFYLSPLIVALIVPGVGWQQKWGWHRIWSRSLVGQGRSIQRIGVWSIGWMARPSASLSTPIGRASLPITWLGAGAGCTLRSKISAFNVNLLSLVPGTGSLAHLIFSFCPSINLFLHA